MAKKQHIPTKVPEYHLEVVPLAQLHPHPRNYREHPEDQIQHIKHSLQSHGVYRNVVVARDYTLLAGHGVVQAAQQLGLETIPVKRLDLDPQDEEALQVLIGDNEMQRLSMVDDRALTELLKELKTADEALLLGTGFDAQMLAALTFVTRPASEILDKDDAAEWVGMPEYEEGGEIVKLNVSFHSVADRARFLQQVDITILSHKDGETWSAWWPPQERADISALRFEG